MTELENKFHPDKSKVRSTTIFVRGITALILASSPASLSHIDNNVQDILRPPASSNSFPFEDIPTQIEGKQNVTVHSLPDNFSETLQFPVTDSMIGMDGGASTTLPNGQELFVYGDTFKKDTDGTLSMNRNSAILVDPDKKMYAVLSGPKLTNGTDTTWITPLQASEGEKIKKEVFDDGSFYWPMPPFVTKDSLYIPLVRNRPPTPEESADLLAWKFVGVDIAKFKLTADSPYPQFETISKLPRPDKESGKEIFWGAGTLVEKDTKTGEEYVYIFGSEADKKYPGKRSVKLARVATTDVMNKASWQFWNGTAWIHTDKSTRELYGNEAAFTEAEQEAAIIIDNQQGISAGFSVNRIGKIVITNKQDDFMGNKILAYIADSPEGPYITKTLVDEVLNYNQDKTLRTNTGTIVSYLAYAHPDGNSDTIPITVSRNLMPARNLSEDEKLKTTLTFINKKGYRPITFTVPKEKIVGE